MNNLFKGLIFFVVLIISFPVLADPSSDKLANCLVENLNGKERKNLAKWVFFAIAAHPEIKSYSSISDDNRIENDKYVASVIMRLLTENCPKELKTAYSVNPQAIVSSFELVGRVAMQELMTNENVTKSLSSYTKYADLEKVNKVLVQK